MADLIDIARSLEPLIREHAEVLEEGRIPPPLVEALYDTGVFKAMLPREVGGLEADHRDRLLFPDQGPSGRTGNRRTPVPVTGRTA